MLVHSVHLLPARQLSWSSPIASAPGLSRHSPDEQIVSHRDRFAQSWSRRKTSLNVNMLSITPPAGYRPSLPACGCRSRDDAAVPRERIVAWEGARTNEPC